ncbi:hypothetical protein SRB17_20570 [Streptomyces sp. RB17]|uniref:hypothetical protein n=1 Tax=Streptomyces sp. RB17 TaxID=2585197 RepID=UPI001296DD23|nr:hypothetical protein [Streptomyces sp. RB17]MQY34091.1 hypothetical protein [Streptomyces sp. RB17]
MTARPQLALAAAMGGAALAVQLLAGAAPSTAAPSPSPSPSFKVGEPIPASSAGLPICVTGVDTTFVMLDQKRAIVVSGTGHVVQRILSPGGAYDDGTVRLRFNTDARSITYKPQGETSPVTVVCKPSR